MAKSVVREVKILDTVLKQVEKPKEVEQMKDFDATEFTAELCSLDNPDCESCGA